MYDFRLPEPIRLLLFSLRLLTRAVDRLLDGASDAPLGGIELGADDAVLIERAADSLGDRPESSIGFSRTRSATVDFCTKTGGGGGGETNG